jgi:hypothetical protein
MTPIPNEVPLHELVVDRPLRGFLPGVKYCPHCKGGTRLELLDSITTLLGYTGSGPDPNHRQKTYACGACDNVFIQHAKYDFVWYTTKDSHLLAGIPACFETFTYNCRCGGVVDRQFVQMDGATPKMGSISQSWNAATKTYDRDHRVVLRCRGCGRGAELRGDHPDEGDFPEETTDATPGPGDSSGGGPVAVAPGL